MSPKAEVWIPKEAQDQLQEAVAKLDGRVLRIEETKPVAVSTVSPSSLAAYFKDYHPNLHFDKKPRKDYSNVLSTLRALPPQAQERLLVGFYTEGIQDFPNGKALGEFLVRVNNIPWFKPNEFPDSQELEKFSNEHLSRLNSPKIPLKVISHHWDLAWDAAGGATRDASSWNTAQNAARDTAWFAAGGAARDTAWFAAGDAAWDMARGAALGTAWDAVGGATWWNAARGGAAAWDAVGGATWITVADLMPERGYEKGNPFEPLIDIYALGCWPIGMVENNRGKKEFVIFVPPIQKATEA